MQLKFAATLCPCVYVAPSLVDDAVGAVLSLGAAIEVNSWAKLSLAFASTCSDHAIAQSDVLAGPAGAASTTTTVAESPGAIAPNWQVTRTAVSKLHPPPWLGVTDTRVPPEI